MQLLALLDEPDELLGRVADLLRGLGQVEQATQGGGVEVFLGRP